MADPVTTYNFCVVSSDISGITGHHSIEAYIEQITDGEKVGTPVSEVHGIEVRALDVKYHGDINAWRDAVAAEMLERHKRRQMVHNEVIQWRGKKFSLPS